ncbi:MAG: hypothetical protein V1800_15505 [Candidatus Latescibacterota bacterium]
MNWATRGHVEIGTQLAIEPAKKRSGWSSWIMQRLQDTWNSYIQTLSVYQVGGATPGGG